MLIQFCLFCCFLAAGLWHSFPRQQLEAKLSGFIAPVARWEKIQLSPLALNFEKLALTAGLTFEHVTITPSWLDLLTGNRAVKINAETPTLELNANIIEQTSQVVEIIASIGFSQLQEFLRLMSPNFPDKLLEGSLHLDGRVLLDYPKRLLKEGQFEIHPADISLSGTVIEDIEISGEVRNNSLQTWLRSKQLGLDGEISIQADLVKPEKSTLKGRLQLQPEKQFNNSLLDNFLPRNKTTVITLSGTVAQPRWTLH